MNKGIVNKYFTQGRVYDHIDNNNFFFCVRWCIHVLPIYVIQFIPKTLKGRLKGYG